MASLALGIAGQALGASLGGTMFGLSAATLGGMVGSAVGSVVDSMIVASMQPDQRIEGQRLESLSVTTSTEGAVVPRVYGRMKVGGNIIWATDFREEVDEDKQGGGKGGGPSVTTVTYRYYVSLALALCEGPITDIGRIWADGELMDLEGVTLRVYKGTETQDPDTFIEAKMGAGNVPAYRGTAYLVFEDLLLERYGNRIPQFAVEVFRPLADDDVAEGMIKSVSMIPATGEYAYATEKVTTDLGDGETKAENVNAEKTRADFLESLDRLQASVPGIESVSLVVSWFGSDLRCGECLIRPGVEVAEKNASKAWSVNGISRASAYVVSQDDESRPIFGGTPADFSVVQAIQEIKARGLKVTFYPFILMDIPDSNTLPNPYSDNAAETGQAAFPWRGRITCSPAPGYAGSPDKTIGAYSQVSAYFGDAEPSDFSVSGSTVEWTGGTDWGVRRMILHYAHLCAAAGGVDGFLIGSEMVGLTTVRQAAGTYPAVAQMQDLAAEVSGVLGSGTEVSYAADWTEYFGHHPDDGTGDVYFHLDPLWASEHIDYVGIDNYMPLSDWRDGFEHLDADSATNLYDLDYLRSNIEGGEGFDWYYASDADRTAQTRTPITDGAEGKPWVFRYKDIRSWWSNAHYNRPGGTEAASATSWTPESKPVRFTEFGCPAVDRGTNQPNVFYDPKSSESLVPYFSRGWRDDAIQRAYLDAVLGYWGDDANNPASGSYAGRMVDIDGSAVWAWDARPYPFFPKLTDVWSDGDNWELGHWITGRVGSVSLGALVRDLCDRAGMASDQIDVTSLYGAIEGYTITALESARASISISSAHFGFDATESVGKIHFRMRGAGPVLTVSIDDLLADANGEPFNIERGQETELPQALKWTVLRSDEEYDPVAVEDQRRVVTSARITSESFPLAVPPEEAFRRVRRSLMERWMARETATFGLPPSRLAIDPMDVVALQHDGRTYDLRIKGARDNEARNFDAVLQDRLAYDLPPGASGPSSLARAVLYGGATIEFMNLPQMRADQLPHEPLLAAYASPWPGELAVYRSPENDGFSVVQTFTTQAQFGTTAATLNAGPTSRFDQANELVIDVSSGTLASVTDLALFSGENAFAVETSDGVWEIVQAGLVELVSSNRYRLTRLLRGQRGTEDAMVASLSAGARVVVMSGSLVNLPINQAEVGLPANWRVGPSSLPVDDDAYRAASFTPEGRGLRPFSPCHVRQPYLTARTTGDLTIEWVRRSRDLSADSWASVEVPMAEESEAYEVDILDGATVLRTLSASTTSAVYTGAQQIADFGAALGPGDTLDIRVAQLSTVYGRGAVQSETLQF